MNVVCLVLGTANRKKGRWSLLQIWTTTKAEPPPFFNELSGTFWGKGSC